MLGILRTGGEETVDECSRRLYRDGNPRLHPLSIVRRMMSAPALQVSIEFGATGPSFVVSSTCASANHAFAFGGLNAVIAAVIALKRASWLVIPGLREARNPESSSFASGPVNAMPDGRAVGHLPAGQGRARKMYVDTSTSDDTVMWANGPGPKGCCAAAAIRRCAPWP